MGFAGVMEYNIEGFKCSGRQYAIQYKEDVELGRERTVLIGASMYLYDEHEKLSMFWRPGELPVEKWQKTSTRGKVKNSNNSLVKSKNAETPAASSVRKRRIKLGDLDSDSSDE